MIITDAMYKKWLNMSKIICGKSADPQDILQETLLKITRLNTNPSKITDAYVFSSIRNMFYDFIKSKSDNGNDVIDSNYILDVVEDEPTDFLELDNEIQSKLDAITDTVMDLDIFDMKLYQLHFIWGLSQREIARRAGLKKDVINRRVAKIKLKITDYYGKSGEQ
jgi:RNA polymerase sigma factor (sigma-70 family)